MMRLVTIQASAIKSVFEVLKEILTDVNIIFKKDGMHVVTLDSARTSLIDMHLTNFDEYECEEEEIVCGINTNNTWKLLKSVTNQDSISIEVKTREFMDITITSTVKKTNTTFQLKLLDINESQIEVPEVHMTTVTTIPSVDFQRLCRDMSNISNEIKITRDKNLLELECEGDFASQKTQIECVEESPHMSGIYSLKYINIFTKSTGMCAALQLMQEESNRFLILRYNVADLGDIKFYLATKVVTET
jgi:proliferating cell nuclear antigen